MDRRRVVIAAAVGLALSLGGCRPTGGDAPLPVGACIRESDQGITAQVPCVQPHTHKVVAIVGPDEQCPREANLFSQPADPDDGRMITCFAPDGAGRN